MLLVGSHLMVAINVMKALKEVDFTPKLVAFSYGPTVPDFVKSLGKDAEYVVAAAEWAPNLPYKDDVFGTARELNANYFKRFGRRPDYVEVASIGGALVQQWAIEKLGFGAAPQGGGQGQDHGGAAQDGRHDRLREDKVRGRRRERRTPACRRPGAERKVDHRLPERGGGEARALSGEAVEGEKVT